MALAWALVGIAMADCPTGALQEAVSTAGALEVAYSNMDDAGFETAHTRLATLIPCIAEEVSPADAVTLHRAFAIGSFVGGDESASRRSWLAVKALQPDWKPSENLMPPGHPMRKLWETPVDGGSPMVAQELAPPGGWSVDGVHQNMVPANRAFILQGFSATGAAVYTAYLYDAGSVPKSLPIGLVAPRTTKAEPTTKGSKGGRLVGSGIAGALAVGSIGGFAVASGAVHHAETSTDDLATTKYISQSRTASAAGIGLVGGAVVVGVATWVIPW